MGELGYVDMFADMFDAIEQGRAPTETFYDGYVVNAVMDACFRSAGAATRGRRSSSTGAAAPRRASPRRRATEDGYVVIKEEHLPDGRRKLILKDPATNEFVDRRR